MGFHQQLERSWAVSESELCIGLDPDPPLFPQSLSSATDPVVQFCTRTAAV